MRSHEEELLVAAARFALRAVQNERVFVQQKLRSIAILKCVGATSREILAVYMTQVLLLGVGGSILGVAQYHYPLLPVS